MPDERMSCPECGQESRDGEWCDHCGAALENNQLSSSNQWLEPGTLLEVRVNDTDLKIRIGEVIEDFATRKVFTATVEEAEEGTPDRVLFVEESAGDGRNDGVIAEVVAHHFRRPFYTGVWGEKEHHIEVYHDVGGVTCEDLVEVGNGQLSFTQIGDVFEACAEAVRDCHAHGAMVLAIAPWTLRIDGFEHVFTSDAETDGTAGFFYSDPITETVADFDRSMDQTAEILNPFQDEDSTGWDVFNDETGVIHESEVKHLESSVVAIFEGLDRTYPIGENPDEVPVIVGFSAPELLGRVRADVSEACDVFGLGMLLYFLVAGHAPPASVYTRYAPALPARNFRPGFPPGLEPVISRATRANPSDRYPSVDALLEAFRAAGKLMGVRASHVGTDRAPRFRLAADTHIGIAKRRRNPINQDSVFARASDDGRFALVVVADGVSTASYGSGDKASSFLTIRAEDTWDELLPAYLMDERIDEIKSLRSLLDRANDDIVNYVNENHTPFIGNPHEVMGSTCLIAILNDGIVTLATLGDSRVYLQNSIGLEQLTADHNLWSLSVLDGIPADSALALPHGDALARCLGTFSIRDGRLKEVSPEPDLFRFAVTRGDTLLFTTDGLVDFAGANSVEAEERILSVLVAEPDPSLACLELILLANRGGGGDNIGLAIAQFF